MNAVSIPVVGATFALLDTLPATAEGRTTPRGPEESQAGEEAEGHLRSPLGERRSF
jgi:hypothetical protein